MLKSFNGYLTDLIVEKLNNGETVLLFSKRFRDHLKMLKDKHPIVTKLLESENKSDFKTKITYIDLVDEDNELISLTELPKLIDFFVKNKNIKEDDITDNIIKNNNKKNSIVYRKNRVKLKVGKLINKLFPDEFKPNGMPGKDIETFVNLFKSSIDLLKAKFELVRGYDITYYYNSKQYTYVNGSALQNSCMASQRSEDYIDFYATNPNKVSLLILYDVKYPTLIKGRALVWNLDKPKGRIFMDRIYTHYDSDILLFKEYAKIKGWLYKKLQISDSDTPIIDTLEDRTISNMILTVNDMKPSESLDYPYLDTLIYYDTSYNVLSNNAKELPGDISKYVLQDTNGGLDMYKIWVNYYNKFFDEIDLQWCEIGSDYRIKADSIYSDYYKVWIAKDYAEMNLRWCRDEEEWRMDDDCVYLKKYNKYISKENMYKYVYSDFSREYIKRDDAIYSDKLNTYIDKNNNDVSEENI